MTVIYRIAATALVTLLMLPAGLKAETGAPPPLPQPRPDVDVKGPVSPPAPLPRPVSGAPDNPSVAPADRMEAPPVPEAPQQQTGVPEEPAPSRVYQAACPAVLAGTVIAKTLPPIDDGVCRVASPLLVSGIALAGRVVALSTPTVLNCRMASQLAAWSARFDAYADTVFKSGVETLLVGTGYMCRPRNNEPGSDYSEHGFANALDVTGFVLENGTRLSLPEDWGTGAKADALRYAHDAACGLFTTVLGPDTNALHADHLHLDLGCHGQSCIYRLCE